MQKPDPIDRPSTMRLGEILARMSRELDEKAHDLSALQWTISALLDKVNHPDLGEEIHVLQNIDRLQQTLGDIAAVIRVVCEQSHRDDIPKAELSAAIRLPSFRDRVGLGDGPPDESFSAAPARHDEDSGITWL